jgi:predicted nucleic acid-binding Zn ribbon protein
MAREAELEHIVIKTRSAYIDGMVDWQDPLYAKIIANLPAGEKPSDYITSMEITGDVAPCCCDSGSCDDDSESMTTYVYETIPQIQDEKPEYFEVKQSMEDAPLTQHPENGRPIRRVVLGGYGVLKSGGAAKSDTADKGGCGCGPAGC